MAELPSALPAAASQQHREGHRAAWRFQALVLVLGLAFLPLAVVAHEVPYFAFDPPLTLALQSIQAAWFASLLTGVSWIGFPPQSNVIFGALILGLFLARRRLEALGLLVAAGGSAGLWFLVAPLVARPRPSPDLVQVATQIPWGSFPSGHVLNLTATFGFLIYLVYRWPKRQPLRWLLLVVLLFPIVTIGVARVYAGAHWPSDVLGGYLLGSLWLALTIQLYRWCKQRLAHGSRPASGSPSGGSELRPA